MAKGSKNYTDPGTMGQHAATYEGAGPHKGVLITDKVRVGDAFRMGRTYRVTHLSSQRGVNGEHRPFAAARGEKLSNRSSITPGSIVFRWINGRVVPIRVK